MNMGIGESLPKTGPIGDRLAGSGAAGDACRLPGRRSPGCEIDAAMVEQVRACIAAVLPLGGGASR